MADTIHLEIVTPERMLFEAEVDSVQVPGLDGELGILPGHSPLFSMLKPAGLLTYVQGSSTGQLVICQGFVEVTPARVKVLAEMAERPEDVDVQKAIAARERAEKNLARVATDPSVDAQEAMDEIERSALQIQVAGKK